MDRNQRLVPGTGRVRPCPACDCPNSHLQPSLNGWELARCEACGTVFTAAVPTPEELRIIYAQVYEPGDLYQCHLNEVDRWKRTGRTKVGYYRSCVFLNRHLPSPGDKLLEVGCGVGSFLAAARRKGWDVEGIDLSETALAASQAGHGFPVRLGTLEELTFPSKAYKAIVCWEVLEHMVSPRAYLRRVSELLRKDGLFVCSVPNTGPKAPQPLEPGPAARPPVHLSFWDRASLAELFRRNGFRILHLAPSRSMLSAVDYRHHPLRFLLLQLGALVNVFEGPHLYAVATPA